MFSKFVYGELPKYEEYGSNVGDRNQDIVNWKMCHETENDYFSGSL